MPAHAETGPFRYNARKVFLTYTRCNIPVQRMYESLAAIKAFKYHCIGQEQHEDGGLHLHALLQYDTPVNTRNQRYWDVEGHHPNIQKPMDVKACLAYCQKEGNFISNWPDPKSWDEILANSTSEEEFMANIKSSYPKEYVLQHERVEYYADKHFRKVESPYKPRFESTEWHLPSEILDWLSDEFPKVGILYYYKLDRPKSLWLCSPSRYGKTEWARSLGEHIYWGGMSNLDVWNPSAQYLVIDDIEWDYVPQKKSLFGGQREFTLTDKYRKKRRIQWGRACIYLFNPENNPMSKLHGDEAQWYRDNTIFITLINKLY